MHQKTNQILLLSVLLVTLILASCGQSPKTAKAIKSDRVAIEFILEDQGLRDSLVNQFHEIKMEQYAWKNHLVLFGNVMDTLGIADQFLNSDISAEIKRYSSPMYVFDKATHCSDTSIQKPWKNYLLTANLVSDTVLQKEYVLYHKNQFEDWPEVAQGFCNANFQQLLVYKNGRQLMLVISIPANKTLDELNPKTVENNPKMDEWNSIMGKYQEGIPGTATGEIWVFLNPIE